MAFIRSFEHRPQANTSFRTEVDCGYKVGQAAGQRIIHFETYGSAEREVPGKSSQTFELDRDGAERLVKILREAFDLE